MGRFVTQARHKGDSRTSVLVCRCHWPRPDLTTVSPHQGCKHEDASDVGLGALLRKVTFSAMTESSFLQVSANNCLSRPHPAHPDGTHLLIEKEQILERCAEQFDSVLNYLASFNDKATARLPLVEPNPELDNLPIEKEFRQAVRLFFCGKAPGRAPIHAKVYKT
ncbi:hypothetical protein ElyMa_004235600 [Elysia marginata]|uniref:Uncharacterized protein n=1 Tax=Elysia marginata TaxID=1093978 RepID=A0AAV4GTL0_9GAST|nr:hypothetical protein ElyMa_004235600 [Elysia marginata]